MAAASPPDGSDAHCHLQLLLSPAMVDLAVSEAERTGVRRIMCCGTAPADWEAVHGISERHGSVVLVSYGVHPHRAAEVAVPDGDDDGWLLELRNRVQGAPRRVVAGIGECGLDFSPSGLGRCPREHQLAVFEPQVRIAKALSAPLTIHCVRAIADVTRILRCHAPMTAPVVFHSFGEHPASMGGLLRSRTSSLCADVFFSFSGAVRNPRFGKVRGSATSCPLERLLIETDSPDQLHGMPALRRSEGDSPAEGAAGVRASSDSSLCGVRGAQGRGCTTACTCDCASVPAICGQATPVKEAVSHNWPGNIFQVAQEIAALRGVPVADVVAASTANFSKAFGVLTA